MSKGGQNPPNLCTERPPSPGGSGEKSLLLETNQHGECYYILTSMELSELVRKAVGHAISSVSIGRHTHEGHTIIKNTEIEAMRRAKSYCCENK